VQIVRVVEDILVRELAIPFGTITEPDPALNLDAREVLRPGEPGLKRQRIRITYENGEELSRELEEETVLREPVTELLAYGTNIVWNTVDTPQGPRRYWRKMRVYATSYSLSRSGTPKSAPWYGRTWLGLPMRHGIVAVDPRYVPLSANLYVPGYGIGFSGDRGGGLRGRHIDLGFDDDNYESWHQYVDLYLLEPLPGEVDMVWLVPD
jgi:3D (Asp-Asp-Asp) domain-containing protein